MNEPTDHGIDTAAAALAKASLFDSTIRHGDPLVIAAWAQILDDIDPDEAVAAVDTHYTRPDPRRIMPGDVLALARAARADKAQRGVLRRRELEAPRDPEASHAGYLAASAALAEAAPTVTEPVDWSGTCRWCHSGPGQPCTTPGTGQRLTKPHPSRLEGANA